MPILSILASDKSVILYRKELNVITGSVTATILLSQVIYWSSKNKGQEFYKFKAPCKHRLYSSGDSWCEELGFTRHEFDSAYKKLEQMGLISKSTNMDRVTHYKLDTVALDKALKLIYIKPESGFMESQKVALDLLTETTTETTTDINPLSHAASNFETFEMSWQWQPALDTVAFSLARSSVPLPVAQALAADAELVGAFIANQLANHGRQYSASGWANRLAMWLLKDWQRMNRPIDEQQYRAARGFDLQPTNAAVTQRNTRQPARLDNDDTSWARGFDND